MKTADFENYTWETTFETAEETMTHTFSDSVKVIVSFRFGTVTTVKDGQPIDKFSVIENPMTISEYETFLLGIAKSVAILEQKSHE